MTIFQRSSAPRWLDLSAQEMKTLLDIRRRVEDAGGEVQGYRGCTVTGGVLF